MWYTTIKKYYDDKHPSYTNESLKNFVGANMITSVQYTQITGVPYVA